MATTIKTKTKTKFKAVKTIRPADSGVKEYDADEADREERLSRPYPRPDFKLRSTFYTYLPDAPVLKAADTKGAQAYLRQIKKVREMGGWSQNERNRMRMLEKKWQERADGKNEWFNMHGTGRMVKRPKSRLLMKDKRELKEIKRRIQSVIDWASNMVNVDADDRTTQGMD